MKKNKILAGLLCGMMVLSSLCVFPEKVSAATVGDTATEEELMDGLRDTPAAEINFNADYAMDDYAGKAEILQDDEISYLHQKAVGLDTIALKTDHGAMVSRTAGSLTKIKFRYAHHTENAGYNDLIIFDGCVEDGYRARFSLINTSAGVQRFFALYDNNGTRTWGEFDLPENGRLAANTWHELALQYDAAHNLTIWTKVNCTGDYVMLTSFKLWKENTVTELRIGYSGAQTGASSICDVDYVRVYTAGGSDPEPEPEPGDAETITGGGQIWLQDDFSDPNNSKAKLEDSQISGGTVNIRPGSDHRDNGTTNFARVTFELDDYNLNGDWIMTMRMKLDTTFWQANIGYGGTRSILHINQNSVKVNENNFAIPCELGEYYDYVYSVKNNETASLYRKKVGTNTWQTVFEDQVLIAWGFNKIEMNSNNTDTSWDIDEIMVYTDALLEFDVDGLGTVAVSASGFVQQGVPNSPKKPVSVILAAYDKEHGYTTLIKEVKKTVPGYQKTDLSEAFDLGDFDVTQNEVAVLLWSSAKSGHPLTDAKGWIVPNNAVGAPERNQEIGLSEVAHYNEVSIVGYAGAVDGVAAALIDENGDVKALGQIKPNDFGMVDSKIAVDPSLPSGSYTLFLQYGTKSESTSVKLYGSEILMGKAIDSAEALADMIQRYGSEEEKAKMTDGDFAMAVYTRYTGLVGAGGAGDLYAFQIAVSKAIFDESTERKLLEEINAASAAKKWSAMETILTKTYAEYLGITAAKVSGIQNAKELYLRMAGTTYHSAKEILTSLNAAITAQKNAEQGSGNGGGGGSSSFGGGSGGGYSGSIAVGNKTPAVSPTPICTSEQGSGETVAFSDLTGVSWAAESINDMCQKGFVSGDGDGTFSPNRAVSREEFLKIVMSAIGIEALSEGVLHFADTDKNAWYYPYVAGAYQAGIVKGISETHFGIGEPITRADMAVMLCRAMDAAGLELTPRKAAFVFNDFSQIPDYAAESINMLWEANLMQGVGDKNFAPLASATRAEATVAVHRIYQYLKTSAKKA